MLPSTSAYTKFCEGTPQSRNALRNSSQFWARSILRTDWKVSDGSAIAVQRRASAEGVGSWMPEYSPFSFRAEALTSLIIGPCRVTRTLRVMLVVFVSGLYVPVGIS